MSGTRDLERAASRHTRSVRQDNWQVAAAALSGQKVFTVTWVRPTGVVPLIGSSETANYIGASIEFFSGACQGFSSTIDTVVSAGSPTITTVTLKDNLPAALATGATFIVYDNIQVTATVSENVSQVGGTVVPTDDAGNPILPVLNYYDSPVVESITVAAGQFRATPTGDEDYFNV